MNKLSLAAVAALFGLVALAPVASATTNVKPAECTDTYSRTFTTTRNGQIINGTAGNDVIFVNHSRNLINGNGGNDCIVVAGTATMNSIKAGAGADVVVSHGYRDALSGEAGNDRLYVKDGARASLDGGLNTDTCVADDTSSLKSCEL